MTTSLVRTYQRLAPALLVAAVVAVVGFLALRTSRVPMIRDFGLMLSVGMVALVRRGDDPDADHPRVALTAADPSRRRVSARKGWSVERGGSPSPERGGPPDYSWRHSSWCSLARSRFATSP